MTEQQIIAWIHRRVEEELRRASAIGRSTPAGAFHEGMAAGFALELPEPVKVEIRAIIQALPHMPTRRRAEALAGLRVSRSVVAAVKDYQAMTTGEVPAEDAPITDAWS